jgi:PAS domain S-box-containing protein
MLPNESARQKALDSLRILDTPPEAAFDQITRWISLVCETPIALVSLVDHQRQWFKARHGLAAQETPREISFCGHAIQGTEIFEIQDAREHPDFCDNPLVTGEPRIGFYAGAPLITSQGHRVGTLCVIDHQPRKLTPFQRQSLRFGADQVMALMELRLYRESVDQVRMQLEEAQSTAKVGSWQYHLETGEQSWSSEHYRIFEIPEPQAQEDLYRMYRERIHPEDLPELDRLIQRALQTGEGFVYDHRVSLDGGKRIKYVQGIGKVTRDSAGKPILISGTCRDKTQDVQNETQYRALVEALAEGVVVQDAQGQIIEFNPAALRILGLTEDQIRGRTSMDPKWRAFREDGKDFPGEEHPAMVALKTGKPVSNVTMGLRLPNDDIRWILINANPTETPEGRRATTTFSDITALVQTREEIRFLLDSLGIGIWKYNPLTQALDWDQSMYRLYERDPKNFSGDYAAWQSLLTADAREQATRDVEAALRGERDFETTFEIQTPSQKLKHIGGRGKVIRNEKNEPILMLGINWDRTREVEMQNHLQLERAKAVHQSKLASLGEMAAGVAHEINNPLAIIVAALHLLPRLKDDPEKFQARIESLDKASQRISKIVNGLRKFSRSEEQVIRKPTAISEIIQESLVLTEPKAKRQLVSLRQDLKSHSQALCDSVEIEQVLVNLINNGIDAAESQAGTPDEKWVQVSTFDREGWVIIQIQDSGPGISPEIEEKLFQPFFTTKAVGAGTGLGLSISKGILDQHGGGLRLNRDSPHTCFEVRLPRLITP